MLGDGIVVDLEVEDGFPPTEVDAATMGCVLELVTDDPNKEDVTELNVRILKTDETVWLGDGEADNDDEEVDEELQPVAETVTVTVTAGLVI